MDLQHRIIRRHRFERDIRVPPHASEAARVVELVGEATPYLLLFATDDADLVAELASFFCERMDVKT